MDRPVLNVLLLYRRYRGSADAVRANLENITDSFQGDEMEDILILSGHGLYDLVRIKALPIIPYLTQLASMQHSSPGDAASSITLPS